MSDENTEEDGIGSAYLPSGVSSVIGEYLSAAKNYAASVGTTVATDGERSPIRFELPKGKVVRVDKVCVALYLMAVRFAMRDQVNALAQIQSAVLGFLGRQGSVRGGKFIAKRIGWRSIPGVSQLVFIMAQIESFFDADAIQNSLALNIRFRSREVREDLVKNVMTTNPKRIRKTKVVFTRHGAKKQRKANASWRSPKA